MMYSLSDFTELIYTALGNGYNWLSSLFQSFGLELILVVVGLVSLRSLFKYVLSPYLSGSGSDSAKTFKKNSKKGGK